MSIEETPRAETRKRIGFLTSAFLPQDDDITAFEFFAVLTAEVVSYLQDKYEIVIRVPKLSTRNNVAREQGKLLETFLAAIELYDALIISPYSVDEIVRTFERVADGITLPPVLTIDQSLKSSRSSVAEKIERWSMEPFNREGGELAASSLDRYYRSISDRPSAPVFIVIRGTGSSPVRAESFAAEIAKRIPACEVLDSKEEGEYTRDRGKRIIQGYLNTLNHATWRQVAGIFACSDELALGACDALEEYTRDQVSKLQEIPTFKLGICGFDGISDVRRLISVKADPWFINTVQVSIDRIAEALKLTMEDIFRYPDRELKEPRQTAPCNLFKKIPEQVTYDELVSRRSSWIQTIRPNSPVVLVITARADEQKAVNDLIGPIHHFTGASRTYAIGEVLTESGEKLLVATVKTFDQGPIYAQATASEGIEEFRPKIIALVGIGGAPPSEDYSLGDVIGCTRFLDYTVGAHLPDGRRQAAGQGARMDHNIRDLFNMAEGSEEIINWASFAQAKPKVLLNDDNNFTCKAEDIPKIRETLKIRFGADGSRDEKPRFVAGPTFTDANLAKDFDGLSGWLDSARDIKAIEMEISGVYQAATRGSYTYPIMAVRGISDVVGFKRDPLWTRYACNSAAFVFHCLLRKGGAPLRKMLTRRQPGID